jgi:hypothetical protein
VDEGEATGDGKGLAIGDGTSIGVDFGGATRFGLLIGAM